MQQPTSNVDFPDALVDDFACDPLSPYEKLFRKSVDPSWPLYSTLHQVLENLPQEVIEATYADRTFVWLYGKNERLARMWFAQNFLVNEVSRRRLRILSEPLNQPQIKPHSAECLRGVRFDEDGLVRLVDFEYNGSNLAINGFSFTICPTNRAPNSTYWLLKSFYEQGVQDAVSVRLDPFLWGPRDSFPQLAYKMLVYAEPMDWNSIGQLRKPHHGRMRSDVSGRESVLSEFSWVPRSDGVNFVCEELPGWEHADCEGARYLHAIYDPRSCAITHLDGALRIYTQAQIEERLKVHLRKAGKAGLRRKIFKINRPIGREAFSLIAQAFFIWNADLATYFRETLALHSPESAVT